MTASHVAFDCVNPLNVDHRVTQAFDSQPDYLPEKQNYQQWLDRRRVAMKSWGQPNTNEGYNFD